MKNADVRLLFTGASIIEGWRSVATDLWRDVLEPRGALNLGIPGETSGQMMWRYQNAFLRGLSPSTVVMQVGANDRTLPAQAVAENIRDIVTAARAAVPGARIVLFGIFPTDRADSAVRAKNAATNALLAGLHAPPAVEYVDCGNLFLDGKGETLPELMPDGLHLSRAGYARWATVLFPLLGITP